MKLAALSQIEPATPEQPKPALDAVAWASLLALVAIWGSAYALVRIGVRTIDPLWLVSLRLSGAAGLIAVGMALARLFLKKPSQALAYEKVGLAAILWFSAVGTIFNALPMVFYAIAAQATPSAVLAICNGGTPIFTAIAANLVLRDDRLTPRRVAGIAIGFAGLLVLIGPDLLKGATTSAAMLALAILGGMLYSGSSISTRLAPRISPMASTLIIMVSGAATSLLAASLLAPFPSHPSAQSMLAAAVLALVPTALAYVIWVWLIQRSGAVYVSLTNYLMPAWAMGLGFVFLGETVGWAGWAALALILSGVAIASRPPKDAAK